MTNKLEELKKEMEKAEATLAAADADAIDASDALAAAHNAARAAADAAHNAAYEAARAVANANLDALVARTAYNKELNKNNE